MWIKKPHYKLKQSLDENVNFLYKEDNIYIMDNHLASAWCWLQEVDQEGKNIFLHIDRHYDLLNSPEVIQEYIIDKKIELKNLNFSEYENLEVIYEQKNASKIFRWDNYILNLQILYPKIFGKATFVTHRDGNKEGDIITREEDFLTMCHEIHSWIEDSNNRCIINIDIDFFFTQLDKEYIQIYTNEVIYEFAKSLATLKNKITVITICLSPECCGGWNNALDIASIFSEALENKFIPELRQITQLP
ncbi:peptide arginase family protein [Croceimicrobium hydrocarbonivorans]|uniref:UPF0489 family protein n=1 Tax=Croceimicrobium hydrocarbonivorans TaxID=2761580 RepID=A0A7H0VAM4_9FLAO|nr:UPF0489 family protein [Croceimicrobium hydrocarbonivorans]QNR22772.1 UPF0489 family protein [Croceimicrobium hydrocarbonivorans]